MLRNWKQLSLLAFVGLCSVVIVADVQGGIFRRRRFRNNNYVNYSGSTSGYGGMNAGAAVDGYGAGAGVNAGVGGYGAGTGVNAGVRGGANVNGANLGAGSRVRAGANVPGVGGANAGGNLNVRGQTPDVDASGNAGAGATVNPSLPAVPATPATPAVPPVIP